MPRQTLSFRFPDNVKNGKEKLKKVAKKKGFINPRTEDGNVNAYIWSKIKKDLK